MSKRLAMVQLLVDEIHNHQAQEYASRLLSGDAEAEGLLEAQDKWKRELVRALVESEVQDDVLEVVLTAAPAIKELLRVLSLPDVAGVPQSPSEKSE